MRVAPILCVAAGLIGAVAAVSTNDVAVESDVIRRSLASEIWDDIEEAADCTACDVSASR